MLTELALETDPQFVEARSSLGLLLIQFLGQGDKGKEMLKNVIDTPLQAQETISLLPFKKEDPKHKGKPERVKNKGLITPTPSVE